MSSSFVIKVAYGGLGDHLFHSHLPRIAKSSGRFARVYVSRRSEFRHPAYRHLIWELNPHVDGFTDDDAPVPEFPHVPAGQNLLDAIMLARGLDDGQRHHEPEVYYQTQPRADVAGQTVYDPNFVSYVGDLDPRRVTRFLHRQPPPLVQLAARERAVAADARLPLVRTESVYDYCDLIRACGMFVCLSSGGATLAAALNRPATVLFGGGQNPMFHHSRLHTYRDMSPSWLRRQFDRWRRPTAAIPS